MCGTKLIKWILRLLIPVAIIVAVVCYVYFKK